MDYTTQGFAAIAINNPHLNAPLPALLAADSERPFSHSELARTDPTTNIVVVLPTDTLGSIISRVVNCCRSRGKVNLLRFHGHGDEGVFLHGTLTSQSIVSQRATVASLRPWFDRRPHLPAEVQLFGCYVGARPNFMVELAHTWGVPVSAGHTIQLGSLRGGSDDTLTIEGGVITACPDRVVHMPTPSRGPRARYADRCAPRTGP
jgi:hypothetical protein